MCTVKLAASGSESRRSRLPCDGNPIFVELELFELPVLPASLAHPNDMRRLMMAAFASHQGELRTQAFIDEEFRHAAGGVRPSFLCVRTFTSGGQDSPQPWTSTLRVGLRIYR